MSEIKTFHKPEEVYDYYLNNKEELNDQEIIACTDTDDYNKKSYVFMEKMNDNLLISVESPDDTEYAEFCSSKESTIQAVKKCMRILKKLSK